MQTTHPILPAGFALAALAAPAPMTAQVDPIPTPILPGTVQIGLEEIPGDFVAPVVLTHAHDGSDRLFVADQSGEIGLIRGGVAQPTAYFSTADLLPELGFFGNQDPFGDYDERGLLGLAFHPGFARPGAAGFGRFYTHTSEPVAGAANFTVALPPGVAPDHQGVIREWTVDPSLDAAVGAATGREVLRIDQPQFNHNGGALAFDPDGLLYASFGDGGAAQDRGDGHGPDGNGQNPMTLHGSIIRIDPLGTSAPTGGTRCPPTTPSSGTQPCSTRSTRPASATRCTSPST